MGCKESKNIATDNTIITPSSSTRSTNRGQEDNDKDNVQTLQRSRSRRSPVQKQERVKEINVGDSKANDVLDENRKSGDNNKGTENAKEGGKLQQNNDQVVEGNKEIIKENGNVGNEAIIKEKEDQNGKVEDNGGKESIVISKEDLPSMTTKEGESIAAINTDGVSGASVYSTPTEVAAGAFDNIKTENAEEKKEPVEETKDRETEETAKENLTRIADANPENYVLEAEVEEKIKDAEAAVESLETLVKEADKAEEATTQYPVKETEEIPVKEVEATNSYVQNPEREADKSEEIQETQVAATDATPQNQVEQTDISEGIPGTETRDTDATLQNAMTESDKTEETLIQEAVENGVKEIHEVTGKAEEIPVKEVETSHKTNQESQALVSDKAEEVLEKMEEAGYATPVDPLKEVEAANTDKENLVTAAEAGNKTEETPVNELESVGKVQSQDEAYMEEDTKSSNVTDGPQISKEADVQINTDDTVKQ